MHCFACTRNDEFIRGPATNQHDGQITKSMSSPSRKNIPLAPSGKSNAQLPPSCPTRGASAVVANAGQGAVDAMVRKTSASVAYGEIVWVRRPDAGVKFKGSQRCPRAMVSQKAGSPGRSRISRKAIAWGRPVCSPLNLYARGQHISLQHACETAGAARTRSSPRPLSWRVARALFCFGGQTTCKTSGDQRREKANLYRLFDIQI